MDNQYVGIFLTEATPKPSRPDKDGNVEDGYQVDKPGGGTTWFDKPAFDGAFKAVSEGGFSFAAAMLLMQTGRKVKRQKWPENDALKWIDNAAGGFYQFTGERGQSEWLGWGYDLLAQDWQVVPQ
jgi:hypothetical protein